MIVLNRICERRFSARIHIVSVVALFSALGCTGSSAVGRCVDDEVAACRCADGAIGEQVCRGGIYDVCTCGTPGPMMCIRGVFQACRCSDGASGLQECEPDGAHGMCECTPGLDGGPGFDAGMRMDGGDAGEMAVRPSWESSFEPSAIIQHPFDSVFYASVPGTSLMYANEVVAVDAETGSVIWTVLVGSDPGPMAISDDGETLYVGLMGSAAIRRVDLVTREAGLEFPLGTSDRGELLYPGDLEVLPGRPEALVVSTRRAGVSPDFAGVAIYDDGVRRPMMTRGHTGARMIEAASAERLYGFHNSSTEFGFRSVNVVEDGLVESEVTRDLFSGFDTDIVFEGGLVFGTDGFVVEPVERRLLGRFGIGGVLAIDSPADRIYFMPASPRFGEQAGLAAYEISTFRVIDTYEFSADYAAEPAQLLFFPPNRFVAFFKERFEDHGAVRSFTLPR